jgi:tetratricopeptide (TPR) repeat protein
VAALFTTDQVDPARIRNDERVAEGIRASVRRLADALSRGRADETDIARRRYAIVVEGDLDRAPRKTLEKRLGVSSRQFTRDQRHLRNEIAAALRQENRTSVGPIPRTSDIAQTVLARCAVLAGVGMPAEALAQIDKITRTQNGQALVVSALCLRSSILSSYVGDHVGASAALTAARSACGHASDDPEAQAAAEVEVDLRLADFEANFGSLGGSLEWSGRATALLGFCEAPSGRITYLRAVAASYRAYAAELAGSIREASEALRLSLHLYRQASGWLAHEEAEFLARTGVIFKAIGQPTEASHYLREAVVTARRSGLAVQALSAELVLGNVTFDRGDLAGSYSLLSACSAEAERLGHAATRSGTHLSLARLHARAPKKQATRILTEVKLARRFCLPGGPHWIDSKISESFAQFLLGDLKSAEKTAREADDAAVCSGCIALRSGTLREVARVAHYERRTRDAKRSIRQAIEFAYTSGRMQYAAQAHELAATILGERLH